MIRVTILPVVLVLSVSIIGQALPGNIKSYLDRNYRGWKLSPSQYACGPATNNGTIWGDFDGDKRRDYAVKFVRGDRGLFVAFVKRGSGYKPFVLHRSSAKDMNNKAILVWKKGTRFEVGDQNIYVRHDAPTDLRCESDVGGIHLYRNGRFIGY